jgi:hypothetical protein
VFKTHSSCSLGNQAKETNEKASQAPDTRVLLNQKKSKTTIAFKKKVIATLITINDNVT